MGVIEMRKFLKILFNESDYMDNLVVEKCIKELLWQYDYLECPIYKEYLTGKWSDHEMNNKCKMCYKKELDFDEA